MYLEELAFKRFNLDYHINANSENIAFFQKLFNGKQPGEIKYSEEILKKGNDFYFNHSTTYLTTDPDALAKRASEQIDLALKNIGIQSVESICDIGCGRGQIPYAAYKMNITTCAGIDIEQYDTWNIYKKDSNGSVEFYDADILYQQHPHKYQLVTSFCAFEHFADPLGMLNAMSDLVADEGYLFIHFQPIWYSTTGHHIYRNIHFPYYHLIFDDDMLINYYHKNNIIFSEANYNKWTAADFLYLFGSFTKLRLVRLTPLFKLNHYWFYHSFPQLLPFSRSDLITVGFDVTFQKT